MPPPQPNLFSSSTEGSTSATRPKEAASEPDALQPGSTRRTTRQRFGRILLAAEFLLAIMVRIFIGVIVLVLPWSPLWDNNHLLQEYPRLATFFSYGATRGVISGLGLLNLWVAVEETLHRGSRHH